MELAPMAGLSPNNSGDHVAALREPQVAGDLQHLIQVLHERVEALEKDNDSYKQALLLSTSNIGMGSTTFAGVTKGH